MTGNFQQVSVRLMSAVWDSGPEDATDCNVLLCLADHANDDGLNCYPSMPRLARMTRRSERTVERSIRSLEEAGWLTVKRGDGRGNLSSYALSVDRLKGRQGDSLPQEKGRRADGVIRERKGDTVTVKGDIVTLKGDIDDKPPHPLKGRTIRNHPEPGDTAPLKPMPVSPGSKGEFHAAYWLQQELGMAATPNDIQVLAQVVQFVARDLAFEDSMPAAEWLYREAKAAEARGQPVNLFWFKDGKYKQPNGGSHAGNRSQQRTNGNLAALAAVRAERRNRELASDPGGSETGFGKSGDLETLLLRSGEVPR